MIEVIGFGLAGACVALQLRRVGFDVRVIDDGLPGSSVVAAGLVNPVAGRNFEPSWQVAEAWEIAAPFYEGVSPGLFHHVPILRLWFDEKDRAKFERKRERVEPWIDEVTDEGVVWRHGGWLDCPAFLAAARAELLRREVSFHTVSQGGRQIWCAGAAGLIRGDFGGISHRSAKGEILTVRIPGLNEQRILNRGGWMIPLGGDLYRVGATYEWNRLDSGPSEEGRLKVEGILRSFTDRAYVIEDHVAGVRPIIDRSKPVVCYERDRGWMVNGLGSKGVIYAPRVGHEMVSCLS